MVEIIPSILSADFARLAEEIARVERGGATMLHLENRQVTALLDAGILRERADLAVSGAIWMRLWG